MSFVLDIDRDRVKAILAEAYQNCSDVLGVEFGLTQEQFVARINVFLESNRVASVPIPINLPSKRYPELIIEVNIQKKSVIARMVNKKLQAHLNRFLTSL